MSAVLNHLGQPVGEPLPAWMPPLAPPRRVMEGSYYRLEPLDPERHAEHLYAACQADQDGRDWTYLPHGPFQSFEAYRAWMAGHWLSNDPLVFAIVDRVKSKALGLAAYLRITPAHGCIEVGGIHFSSAIKRSPGATEAMYLMMKNVFDLGYRRYEWKCDSLNAPSRAAAQRLGFSYEGIFRQAIVYKNRNRDTAWYAIIDSEWPALRAAFTEWLDPSNFDAQGRQRLRLSELTAAALRNSAQPG